MASIVLVDPPGWQGAVHGHRAYPNVGIAYLGAALRQHGHQVAVLDFNNEARTEADLLRAAADGADLIAFSMKTATVGGARKLAQALKQERPDLPVVVGGPHVSLAWRQLAAESWLDVVCVGEGEENLVTICQRLPHLDHLSDLTGVFARSEYHPALAVEQARVLDLDALPFPDYHLFNPQVQASVTMSYPLVTSRGCSYKCTFCSVPAISGRKLRRQSPSNVIRELEWARQTYGIQRFEVIDDLFNLDMKRCAEICRELIASGLGLGWGCPNGVRADRINPELADLMAKAGCDHVMVGIESADPEVLESVKKGETIEEVEHGIRTFKAAGIRVGGFFIIGLPGDNFAAEEKSVEFAKRTGINAFFNLLVPYPGTELYEWSQLHARQLRSVEDGVHYTSSDRMTGSVMETDDFKAADRVRAYEMANTRLRSFEAVLPRGLSPWRRRLHSLRLVWRHDRGTLPAYVATGAVNVLCGALGLRRPGARAA